MSDKFIIVIDIAPRSGKRKIFIAKRHPDGTYYTMGTTATQADAVDRVRYLNWQAAPKANPVEAADLMGIVDE
jgi:hypothetical protein